MKAIKLMVVCLFLTAVGIVSASTGDCCKPEAKCCKPGASCCTHRAQR